MASQLPFEHIDPLNGNLLLAYTDLSLPGNAGFDLKIQRTYNSKIFANYPFGTLDADSWAGVGWSLHLGRVRTTQADVPLAVEMPDGSSHKLFEYFVGDPTKYVTRDYWIYDRNANPPQLKTTNGVVYTFGKIVDFGSVNRNRYFYPTLIQDPFGNRVEITYASVTQAPDAFLKITQFLGSTQKREITFGTETLSGRTRLRTMTYSGRTWTFSYAASAEVGKSLLTSVKPPVGPTWGYGYTTSGAIQNELVSVTTPNGGVIEYTYGTQGSGSGRLANPFRLGSTQSVLSRVVTSRSTSGRSVPAGTWTYWYAQGAAQNQTVITAPSVCTGASVTTYTFLGVGNNYTTGSVWKIGVLDTREVRQGGTLLESEHLDWRDPQANDYISPVTERVGPNTDVGIYAPVVAKRTITRSSQSYVTTNTYRSQAYSSGDANFNDYGRPYEISESGNLARTTSRSYRYGFTPYIVDRIASETVTVSGESFTKSWGHTLSTGFTNSETIYGIQTTYTPSADGLGNVGSRTNANGHKTTYAYDWGVLKSITPLVAGTATTRVINPEGTVASETRRGFTTSYQYDDLFRVKTQTPPEGNATLTSYDNTGGAWIQVTRGASSTTTTLDGFGRSIATSNSVGVQTSATYDACERKTYESYPFKAPEYPSIGTTYAYDGLDRLTRKTNPDNSYATFSYDSTTGIDVTTTDENIRATVQDWSAFGDPRDARLVAVTDAGGTKFSYSYNALGSLTKLTPASGPARTWAYFGNGDAGGTPGLLKSETHPENGTVTYTYYAAGNLKTRNDAAFGGSTYTYDDNERLIGIDRPGTAYDTTIGYDGSDNRTLLQNSHVRSTFGFDGANRLRSRQDVVNSQTLSTTLTPDGNDNVQRIDYPSGNAVVYTYDSENRISTVKNGPATTIYADGFSYHPSGAALSFKPGGSANPNPAQKYTYDNRYRLKTLTTGQRSLTYGYDVVGNPTSITEGPPRLGKTTRSTIVYDAVDRLTSVAGFAGGSYGYDTLGNRTSSTAAQTPATYSYDSATTRLKSYSGSTTLAYDSNGNLTDDGRPYTYTPENLLERVGPPTSPAATYRYDGDNLRTIKIDGVSGATRYYTHGPGGEILSEFEEACAGNRRLLRDYVYANGRLVADVKPAVAPVRVGFVQPSSSPSEAAGTLDVTLQVTTADGSAIACPVNVRFTTADGTATAGTDYSATTGTRTFLAGSPSGAVLTIPVTIMPNSACQGNRAFSVQLFDASGAAIVAGPHVVTIVEDDLVCLSGSKSFSGAFTAAGAVDYSVVLTNSGSQAQRDNAGPEFTDGLSSFLTLDSVTASSGTASRAGNTALWNGTVAPGGAVTIAMRAHLNGDSALQVIPNTGTINYDLHNTGTNAQTASTNTVSFMVGSGAISFYTVSPCRLVDTRNAAGPVGGPELTAGASRVFPIAGYCGIPAGATAVSLNITVVDPPVVGNVALYPAGITPPATSTVNYVAGITRANNAIVLLNNGQLEAICRQVSGTLHVVIDVNGYFR